MISTKGRYAIRVMIDLAENDNGSYIPLKDIAARQEVSKKYLEIIVKTMVTGGLIEGASGKGGGYKLTRKPEDYPMYFEEQLQKCGVDYFDYYLLHNIGVDRYDCTKATGGTKSGQYYERSRIGHGAAKDCLHCGLCEEICPQHIEIRSFLEKFMSAFADFEERYSS